MNHILYEILGYMIRGLSATCLHINNMISINDWVVFIKYEMCDYVT